MLINTSTLNWIVNVQQLLARVLPTSGFLIKEDGGYILQENGDRIIL